ncbi:TonB-dependent siderophore receptor [Flavobacterium sp. HBTb2-11-1]|uniref:TonB-dependent receptor plug domain-containing protein n=1 Tax=Flavobacterium sp. HBTb2-11-1 TaxID=2692212 RepID=UPI00136C1FB4|nr:outer membrane beta-barrel protein [Flavobacterium sp. HBTb2-11-1]MXO06459.1 outer membrane beta-barrel protein [Flavobacterium sp. HBTb2-11-1]
MRFTVCFFLLCAMSLFSQEKNTISGKVLSDNKPLQDILVELKIGQVSKFSISNKKGEYKFDYTTNDTVFIKVKNYAYKEFSSFVDTKSKNTLFNIDLVEFVPEMLNEVVIKSTEKNSTSAKKVIYQINHKDYLQNAKVSDVLQSVPNVYFNEFDGKVLVDGVLNGKIFIDGLEADASELRGLKAEDVKSVEIINNPSVAYYKSEFLGAIINVITKTRSESFLKGSLEGTAGVINNYWAFSPNFSFKKDFFLLRTNFQYLNNDQVIDFTSKRIDENGLFYQSNTNQSNGKQLYSNTRISIKLNNKSNFTVSNNISQYSFFGKANGFTVLNEEEASLFSKIGKESMVNWSIASVYNYKITESNVFFFKSSYSIFNNENKSQFDFYNNSQSDYYNIQSKNNELSLQADYELEEVHVFGKKMDFYTDIKYINRKYSFSHDDFYVYQNVFDSSVELDSEWSNKFSTEVSLTYEFTNNSNQLLRQSYNLLLPTINSLYHFGNKLDLKAGYSRKVLRPSASDLNDDVLILYPGVAKQGNSELDPQIRDYYFLMLTKFYKSDSFSFKIYNESINNAITSVYRTDGDLLIQTLENAARYNSIGMNVGFKTKLVQKITANINSGFDYNVFEDNSKDAIIRKNSGYTFRGNFNLSGMFFKDKVSISVSGRQDGPSYSLLSKRITNPYLDFTISTNILKGKLNLSVYGRNLLGRVSSGFTDLSDYNNFYQKIETKNNSRNLLLTLTYNFGKKFSDRIESQDINNSDVRR